VDLSPAIDLIRQFEGFRSEPYLCPARVPTIGWGFCHYGDGRAVSLDDAPMPRAQADALLEQMVGTIYLPGVLRLCPPTVSHSGALNALVDFAWNLGLGRLQTSTLRRVVNARDWGEGRRQLRRWVRAGGRVLPGLVARREAESALLPL